MNILSDNAAALVQRNAKLKEEISRQMQENHSLRNEIAKLRQKLVNPPAEDVVDLIDDGAQSEVTPVGEPEVLVAPAYIESARKRKYVAQLRPQEERTTVNLEPTRKRYHAEAPPVLRERNSVAQEPSRQRYYAAASQMPRERKPVEPEPSRQRYYAAPKERPREKAAASRERQYAGKTRPQEQLTTVPQGRLLKGSSRNPATYRKAEGSKKRDRSRMFENENVTLRTQAPRRSSSLLRKSQPRVGNNVGACAGRSAARAAVARAPAPRAPAPRSYVGGNASALSRFTATPSQRWQNRANSNSIQMATRSLASSWQARVSTVPRPSVTPDQLERMRKRPRPSNNPLAPRR